MIEAIVRVMLTQLKAASGYLGTCTRVPTVVWTKIDRVSKIA